MNGGASFFVKGVVNVFLGLIGDFCHRLAGASPIPLPGSDFPLPAAHCCFNSETCMNLHIRVLPHWLLVVVLSGALNVSAIVVEEELPDPAKSRPPARSARRRMRGIWWTAPACPATAMTTTAARETMWHSAENPAASSPAAGLPASRRGCGSISRSRRRSMKSASGTTTRPNLTDRGFRQARLFTSADGTTWEFAGDRDSPRKRRARASRLAGGEDGRQAGEGRHPRGGVELRKRLLRPERSAVRRAPGRGGEGLCRFPTGMACEAQALLRPSGRWPAGPRDHAELLRREALRQRDASRLAEKRRRFDNLPGASQLTLLLPAGMGVTNECDAADYAAPGQRSLEADP